MNLTKNTILTLGVLAAASVSFAQNNTATTSTAPVGLLGQSYSEASFGVTDIKHYSDNGYSLGVAGNVPVAPGVLDFNGTYDYSWIRGAARGHANSIGVGPTVYTTFAGVKPFVGGMIGYEWDTFTYGRNEQANWGLDAGVEIPVSVVTITPRIAYSDDFRSKVNSTQQTSYSVEGNYWVTKTAGAFASVGYTDVRHSSFDSWNYTVGARFKF